MNIFLTSTDAAEFLGVSRRTLYAYVSRGWIRSESSSTARERRYSRLDLERLRDRKQVRKDPVRNVSHALSWGVPLLETELTLIDQGRFFYRGLDAVELARTKQFFEVVNWFWHRNESELVPARVLPAKTRFVGSEPVSEFQRRLIKLGDAEPGGYDFSIPNVFVNGWRILELFLQCVTGCSNVNLLAGPDDLQRAWATDQGALPELLNTALILSIDHELNVSSFTARVVASAGSNIYEVVNAAVCAMRGSRHGGMGSLCYEFLKELETSESLRPILVRWVRDRGFVPGFGHHLYPAGDIRARVLLEMMKQRKVAESQLQLIREAAKVLRQRANIDLALAVLARAFGLPPHAPLSIFILGRIAGWIGHAVEQRTGGGLIRPRARYIGPLPAKPFSD
jgi:citrate synthase